MNGMCDHRHDNGAVCSDDARWRVTVGTREVDEEESCTAHLGEVASAMYEAEGRKGAVLQVRPA